MILLLLTEIGSHLSKQGFSKKEVFESNNEFISGGGFKISALKTRNGRPRTQVQHLMQIDLKGWGVNYIPWYQQRCVLQMVNSVAGKH